MTLGLYGALLLRLLLQDLGYLLDQPIHILCDNKAACDIAHNPVQHVKMDRSFIKEKLDLKVVELSRLSQKINWLTFSLKQSPIDHIHHV